MIEAANTLKGQIAKGIDYCAEIDAKETKEQEGEGKAEGTGGMPCAVIR